MSRRTTLRFTRTCALAAALLSLLINPKTEYAQAVSSTTLNLSTDATAVVVHTVVHLTASIQTFGLAPTGSVTFLDGAGVIASVPLSAQGTAILGVASLTPGNHTLTASYPGDTTHTAATSGTVTVAITGFAAPFTTAAAQTSIYANQPVTFTVAGLPSSATGSVDIVESSTNLATSVIPGTSIPAYQAFGDGITSGQSVSPAQSYPSLFASADGFSVVNLGAPNSTACDLLPSLLLAHGLGPSQTAAPLTSLMIGSSEMDAYGSAYLPTFIACDQSAIAWLAIPREYKVLAGDAGATVSSGSWTQDPATGTLLNTSGSGSASFTLTSTGGPIYLWYLLGDALPGTLTVAIDGVPGTTTYSTQPAPAIGSLTHSPSTGFALLRFPLSVGPHILAANVQSGTVGILGAATPPSPAAASVHPTVLVSDIPNQLTSAPVAPPALLAAYTQSIQSSANEFQADGLDVRLVSTQPIMLGTPPEMTDPFYPNALGQSHLAQAFESAFGNASTVPYATFNGSSPTASVSFSAPGVHTVSGAYSGDSTYAPGSSSPISITVLPQNVSVTSLSTQTTSYPLGSQNALTAIVTPALASGTVTFFDGTAFLAQDTLVGGMAATSTETLALGLHQLSAVYNGDAADASSASPALTVRITPGTTAVTLSPLPASAAYGSIALLTASVSPADALGTITFEDSVSGTLGQTTIAGGTATVNSSSLAVGVHTLTAFYSGDNSHLPSTSSALTLTIEPLPTAVTLVAQPAQIIFGTAASLIATLSPAVAGGSVVFRDVSSGVLGTATVNAGVAVLSTSALPAGLRNISAAYQGDALHASSVSLITTVAVSVAPTSVTLAALPSSINAGTPLTLTATVTPASATGTLLFEDPAAGILGQATISRGAASLLLSSLPAGTYSITAVYPGDTDYSGSSSMAVSTQVVLQPSSATLAPLVAPAPYATTISLTASVSPSAAGGILSLYDGANVLGEASLLGGQAVFHTAALGTGSHQLHVVYGGNGIYAASTSPAIPISITPDTTVTTLGLAQVDVPLGGPVVFNVRVSTSTSSKPGGTVTLHVNGAVLASGSLANITAGAGFATLSVASAAVGFGTFSVTAYYSGDGNDAPSDTSGTPASFSIVSSTTVTALSLSSTQVPPQSPITLIASVRNPSPVMATGSVQFSMNSAVIATVPLDSTGSASTQLGAQPVGSYSLSAQYVPSGPWTGSASAPQALTVTLPVALVLTPNMLTLTAGESATVTLGITPLSGFAGTVRSQCTSSAPFVTCSMDALSSITGPVSSSVHLTVAKNTLAALRPNTQRRVLLDAGSLAFLMPCLFFQNKRRKTRRRSLLALCAIGLLSGCATGGNFGTVPPGRQLAVVSVTAAGTITTAGIAVQAGP